MLRDCNALVCRNCARRYEPELMKLLAVEPNYYGDCPTCWHNDGYRNVRREHWFFCRIHRVCWHIGSNLFSAWRDETEEIWQKNIKLLWGYTVIGEETHRPASMQNKSEAISDSVLGTEDISF